LLNVYTYGRRASLSFALGLGAPVAVVDSGVLEQSSEDEDEADDEVNVDSFDVRDTRQSRPNARTDGRHRQHRRYTCVSAAATTTSSS